MQNYFTHMEIELLLKASPYNFKVYQNQVPISFECFSVVNKTGLIVLFLK